MPVALLTGPAYRLDFIALAFLARRHKQEDRRTLTLRFLHVPQRLLLITPVIVFDEVLCIWMNSIAKKNLDVAKA